MLLLRGNRVPSTQIFFGFDGNDHALRQMDCEIYYSSDLMACVD